MAAPAPHSIVCPQCGGKLFREEKIVELNASVMVTRGMSIPAQVNAVSYQYACIGCNHILDEQFTHGHVDVK
ncbi:hypothetical protein [Sulfoacidibacillus thermotolerans]|uniref:Uncharacterized protein n=1 Tax=Sulfoacidibacillus thermotolerans TaxID=1765684 RepID=A0A2U3DC88_SULT2|nr:hypothetical protein [Sulfoacidibacillus thermotolerans]PWI58903.1 hypothetical protein BM613_02135 [Sulfoacidibacillus thermotolerans]